MQYEFAHQTAMKLLEDTMEADRLLESPGECVSALVAVELLGGDEDDLALIHKVYDKLPGLLNFDERGNWTGPVPNENGLLP